MERITSRRLTALQAKERETSQQLSEIKEDIKAEKLKLFEAKYGIKAGSIVRSLRRDGVYKVARVETISDMGKPWVYGCRLIKSGGWGRTQYRLFSDWELVPQ